MRKGCGVTREDSRLTSIVDPACFHDSPELLPPTDHQPPQRCQRTDFFLLPLLRRLLRILPWALPVTHLVVLCYSRSSSVETAANHSVDYHVRGCWVLPINVEMKLQDSVVCQLTLLPIFFFFFLFRTAPMANGSPQTKGRIRVKAASLHHSHSITGSKAASATHPAACGNSESLTHWLRPGIEPSFSQARCWVFNPPSHNGNSCYRFLKSRHLSNKSGLTVVCGLRCSCWARHSAKGLMCTVSLFLYGTPSNGPFHRWGNWSPHRLVPLSWWVVEWDFESRPLGAEPELNPDAMLPVSTLKAVSFSRSNRSTDIIGTFTLQSATRFAY